MVAVVGGLPVSHCVDDMLSVERARTSSAGFRLWRSLAALSGWDIPDRKSPPPTTSSRILGVQSDLSPAPASPPVVRVARDRAELLREDLLGVLRRGRLGPGLAGKLYGRLQFATTQTFGRTGKSMLRPFSRRQHEPGRSNLNPQLSAVIHWWLEHLERLPERPVPTSFASRRVVVSYSDGEGAGAQVGIALWLQGEPIGRAGVVTVPESLRRQ